MLVVEFLEIVLVFLLLEIGCPLIDFEETMLVLRFEASALDAVGVTVLRFTAVVLGVRRCDNERAIPRTEAVLVVDDVLGGMFLSFFLKWFCFRRLETLPVPFPKSS